MIRVILASASPARRRLLAAAGLAPEVVVSGVDEEVLAAGLTEPIAIAQRLAEAKAADVAGRVSGAGELLVIGCDSVLEVPAVTELAGQALGKPLDASQARQRWLLMRGHTGLLHTGHSVLVRRARQWYTANHTATTEVTFTNDISESEIDAYIATGEPLQVAGAFTLDGIGSAYVTAVSGDPANVVGLSVPLLRRLVGELGISWPDLWQR